MPCESAPSEREKVRVGRSRTAHIDSGAAVMLCYRSDRVEFDSPRWRALVGWRWGV